MIFKNLYSLQNAQRYIFQLICIKLCKCLNCFLKTHNKQLNKYSLNFIFYFYQKKKVLKNGSSSDWVALTRKNTGQVISQPVFTSIRVKINQVWVEYFRVKLSWIRKFWLFLSCLLNMTENNSLYHDCSLNTINPVVNISIYIVYSQFTLLKKKKKSKAHKYNL